MITESTTLRDVIRIVPDVHRDDRGYFLEMWRKNRFEAAGIDAGFVQENLSYSVRGTLRGLHYQVEKPQGRLVRVVHGEVFDVAVDLRRSSPDFGRWSGEVLSVENQHQVWIPPGFAHGFLVLSDTAAFQYNCTEYYAPEYDRGIRWDDPDIGIEWPLADDLPLLLSDKDRSAPALADAETYR